MPIPNTVYWRHERGPLLAEVARALEHAGLEAVLIGNAAAALQGIAGARLRVAALADIIKSKRAAGRPRDLAVIEILEIAREESHQPTRPARRRRARKPA